MAPITDPSLPPCTSNAAERTTALLQPLSPTSSRSPARRLLFYEGARGKSTKRRGQRARPPQSKALGSNRRSAEIAAALASTRAERSLKVVTAVGPSPAFASRAAPRAKPKRARPPQSSAVKLWAQASAAATFTRQTLLRLNLPQLQRSLASKSLQPYPPPLARGEVVAASRRRSQSRYSQLLTPCRPAQASNRCVASARVSL